MCFEHPIRIGRHQHAQGDARQVDLSLAPPAWHVKKINVSVVVRVRASRQVHPGCLESLSALMAAVHFAPSRVGAVRSGGRNGEPPLAARTTGRYHMEPKIIGG